MKSVYMKPQFTCCYSFKEEITIPPSQRLAKAKQRITPRFLRSQRDVCPGHQLGAHLGHVLAKPQMTDRSGAQQNAEDAEQILWGHCLAPPLVVMRQQLVAFWVNVSFC